MRPREDNPGSQGYFRVVPAILANQDQSGAAIGDVQNDRLTAPGSYWLHANDEKFTHGLVEILNAQLRTDLGRGKREAELPGAGVNGGQCHGIGLEAKLGR